MEGGEKSCLSSFLKQKFRLRIWEFMPLSGFTVFDLKGSTASHFHEWLDVCHVFLKNSHRLQHDKKPKQSTTSTGISNSDIYIFQKSLLAGHFYQQNPHCICTSHRNKAGTVSENSLSRIAKERKCQTESRAVYIIIYMFVSSNYGGYNYWSIITKP